MCDLRVAGLVRTDEAEAIAAENGCEAVKQEEEDEAENDGYLKDGRPGGQASSQGRVGIGRRRLHQFSLHVQNLFKYMSSGAGLSI
jgi:hypothetical protein